MPVLIDSTKLARRLSQIYKELTPGSRALDMAVKKQLQAGIDEFFDIIVQSPDMEDQVGFDEEQFYENIQGIVKLGPHQWGILDTDKMGGAEDINALAGQKGMFVPGGGLGSGNEGKFQQYIQGESAGFGMGPHTSSKDGTPSTSSTAGGGGNRRKLEARRRNAWGTKTPQWIVAAYGKAALGLVSEGLSRGEVSSFIVRNFKAETIAEVAAGVRAFTGELVRQEGSTLFGPGAMAHYVAKGTLARGAGGRFFNPNA